MNALTSFCLAVSAAALASAAQAAPIDFQSLGSLTPPSGEVLLTTFANADNLTLNNAALVTGPSGIHAPPEFTSGPDANQYLSVYGGGSATYTFGSSQSVVSLYIGSLDTYNQIAFSNGQTFVGDDLAAYSGADNGSWTSGATNGWFTFHLDGAASSVTLSSGSNSFEVAAIAGVPEPASWAMIILGAGLTGASLRARRAKKALAA